MKRIIKSKSDDETIAELEEELKAAKKRQRIRNLRDQIDRCNQRPLGPYEVNPNRWKAML